MYCTKCGQQSEDGTVFCSRCGNNLQSANQSPTAPAAAPVYQGYAQGYPVPKKSNKGLIIGLSVGAAVLVIAAVLLFVFILPGGSGDIAGKWYEQTGFGGTVEFLSGGNVNYEAAGFPMSGKYTYNSGSKTGQMTIEIFGMSEDVDFALEGNMLNVDGAYFTRDVVEQQDLSDMMDDLDLSGFGDYGSDLDSLDLSDFDFAY
jgi:hypothetical protein